MCSNLNVADSGESFVPAFGNSGVVPAALTVQTLLFRGSQILNKPHCTFFWSLHGTSEEMDLKLLIYWINFLGIGKAWSKT